MKLLQTLRKAIAHVESHPDPDLVDFEELQFLIRRIEREATEVGNPAIVQACDIRSGPISTNHARSVLAACLAALPQPSTLTPPMVAKELSVSSDTVLGWIRSGALKAANLGTNRKRYSIHRADLDRFLSNRKPEPPPRRGSFKRYSA